MYKFYKYLILLTILILLSGFLLSGDSILIKKNVRLFDVNVLGNYAFVDGNKVSQFQSQNLWFEDLSLGQASCLNADDALNIMVFYPEVQKIVFLDNSMSLKLSPIDLNNLGFNQISTVCMSYNTGFWLFDPINIAVYRYDRLLKETHSSGNLNQILGFPIFPISMSESNNLLVLNDTSKGVFIFDNFGNYIKNIPIPKIQDFQILDQSLFLLRQDTLFNFQLNFKKTDTLILSTKGISKFKFSADHLYLLNKNGDLFLSK